LRWNEAPWRIQEAPVSQAENAAVEQEHEREAPQHDPDEPRISPRRCLEAAIEELEADSAYPVERLAEAQNRDCACQSAGPVRGGLGLRPDASTEVHNGRKRRPAGGECLRADNSRGNERTQVLVARPGTDDQKRGPWERFVVSLLARL